MDAVTGTLTGWERLGREMDTEDNHRDPPDESAPKPQAEAKKPEPYEDSSVFELEPEFQSSHRLKQPRRVIWSVVWADLMMTMFIMFAVMYIFQAGRQEFSLKKEPETQPVPREVRTPASDQVETLIESLDALASRVARKESEVMRLRRLSDIGTVDLTEDKAIRIVLPGDLLFDAGQVDLKPSAMAALREVGDAIRITDYRVNVVGHTDSVPIRTEKVTTNWELSALRACAVVRFLIEEMQLSPDRFYVSGHAHLQPMAPNDTPANRAANRRVELILTKAIPTAETKAAAKLP